MTSKRFPAIFFGALMQVFAVSFFIVVSSGLASAQTKAPSPKGTTPKPAVQNKPAEAYRPLTPADGIHFYLRAHSVGTVVNVDPAIPRLSTDQITTQVNIDGADFGVIGDDQKEIAITLVSPTVVSSQLQTKDFGIIKVEMTSNMAATYFVTEKQIKQLRALAAGSGK